MRITKQVLTYRWLVSTLLAALVFAVLTWSELRLKSLSGFGTSDLQGFSTADQYRQAFMAWPGRYAVRAGFKSEQLQELLCKIASHLPVKAFTIAGYDPSYDSEGQVCALAFAAAAAVIGCRAGAPPAQV